MCPPTPFGLSRTRRRWHAGPLAVCPARCPTEKRLHSWHRSRQQRLYWWRRGILQAVVLVRSEESFVVEEAMAMSTSPLLVFVVQYRGNLMVAPAPPQDMSILRQNEPWKECPHCRTALSLPKVHRQIIHIVESSSLAAQPLALAPAPPPPPPPSTPFPIHTLVLQISQHLPKNISNSPLPSPFWQHAPSSTPEDPTASPRTLTPEPKETRCLLPHTRVASPACTDSSRLRCLADQYPYPARGQR